MVRQKNIRARRHSPLQRRPRGVALVQAQYHLSRIAAICGTGCMEYRSLAAALEKPPGTGLVW